MLSQLQKTKLRKINADLKKFGVLPLSESMSREQLAEIGRVAAENKKSIMESTAFNSYHTSPEYASALLIQEAIEILTNPEDDSPIIRYVAESKSHAATLDNMKMVLESFIKKNGAKHPKVKAMREKIAQVETTIYESAIAKKMHLMLKESAGKAQTIMSAKGLQDDMIEFQGKVGEIQNKYADSFISMVNDEYGADIARDVQSRLMSSLDELMLSVRKTKDDMLNIVNILSGTAPVDASDINIVDDESISSDDGEAFGDDEGDVFGSESDDLEGGDEPLGPDLDLDADDEPSSDDFKRKD